MHPRIIHILIGILAIINVTNGQSTLNLKFHHLNVETGLPQNSVYTIQSDKFGFIWLGTWGGAVRYDGYTCKVFRPQENDSTALPSYRMRCMVSDSAQNIWIQTENSEYVYQYDDEKHNFIRHPWNNIPEYIQHKISRWHLQDFKEVESREFRFSISNNGLLQTNRATGETYVYKVDRTNPFALSDNSVKSVFLDDQENLWVGTQNGGVNMASLYTYPFQNIYANQNGEGLVSNGVRAVCTDKNGRIYVGSENRGITIIDRKVSPYIYHFLAEDVLSNLQIRALHCDDNGIVWIGTKAGLFKFNPHTNKMIVPLDEMEGIQIFSLYSDHNKTLWVGTMNGLARLDTVKHRLAYLPEDQKPLGSYIRSMIEDTHKNIWVATEDSGITCLSRKIVNGKESFAPIHFKKSIKGVNALLSDRTYSITKDDQGYIWVATNYGLSRLNPENYSFKNFTIDDELPDNRIMSVLFDGINSVWVSHNKGLTRINTSSLKMQNFDRNDGLQGNEFIQSATYNDAMNQVCYFGGANGLSYFKSNQITSNPFPPKIVFTDLYVNYKRVTPGAIYNENIILEKSLECTDSVTLPWKERNFRIDFAALHYANPSGNLYKYKLDGYDKDWVSTNAALRSASYSNLKAGTYIFKVLAANSDGVWTSESKCLTIQILPSFWLSKPAFIIYALLFTLIALGIYRIIRARIKARHREVLNAAKSQFFTELSHEFRTPLTLILDPLQRLINETIDATTAHKYYGLMQRNAQQLLQLINQLLDFRKLESGHMKLTLGKYDLILFMRKGLATFEQQAANKKIELKLETFTSSLHMLFDEQKLTMVMNNLLSNAIKFTPEGGKIHVRIVKGRDEKEVIIEVEDNGVGIEKSEQKNIFEPFYQAGNNSTSYKGTGIGLSLTRKLVEIHNGSIDISSKPGVGTLFSIHLPMLVITNQMTPSNPSQEKLETKTSTSNEGEIKTKSHPLLLVVDDNQDIREYIQMNFKNQYRILLAKDGSEGLEIAKENVPDIIISDVMMPRINGLEFCSHLKTDPRTSHIPVILLTARQSDQAKTEGYQTGADAYITKPFNTQLLQVRLQNLLEQRQRLRERFSQTPPSRWKNMTDNSADQEFLKRVQKYVEQQLDNPDFSIDQLAVKVGMSRSQFYRKIKALSNQSGNDFITSFRMEKAAEYLIQDALNVTETAYKVGYAAPNSFTRAFQKHFGVPPTQYIKNNKQ